MRDQTEEMMRLRPTARLLILDRADRVLLFRVEDAAPIDPNQPDILVYWMTPGGGVEPGETFEETARRELWEETGIREATFGPCVWTRERTIHFADESVLFQERYIVVRVADDAVSVDGLLDYERAVYCEHRWWPLAAIHASDETFMPPGFASLLAPIAAGQLPATPIGLATDCVETKNHQ